MKSILLICVVYLVITTTNCKRNRDSRQRHENNQEGSLLRSRYKDGSHKLLDIGVKKGPKFQYDPNDPALADYLGKAVAANKLKKSKKVLSGPGKGKVKLTWGNFDIFHPGRSIKEFFQKVHKKIEDRKTKRIAEALKNITIVVNNNNVINNNLKDNALNNNNINNNNMVHNTTNNNDNTNNIITKNTDYNAEKRKRKTNIVKLKTWSDIKHNMTHNIYKNYHDTNLANADKVNNLEKRKINIVKLNGPRLRHKVYMKKGLRNGDFTEESNNGDYDDYSINDYGENSNPKQYEMEIANADLADLTNNIHKFIPMSFAYNDLGRRFVLQYPYTEVQLADINEDAAEIQLNQAILEALQKVAEANKLTPVRESPDVVLDIARKSVLRELREKSMKPNEDEELQNNILRTGEFWNGYWKEDVDPDILFLRSKDAIRVKVMPGSRIHQIISIGKKISPQMLYIINKPEL